MCCRWAKLSIGAFLYRCAMADSPEHLKSEPESSNQPVEDATALEGMIPALYA